MQNIFKNRLSYLVVFLSIVVISLVYSEGRDLKKKPGCRIEEIPLEYINISNVKKYISSMYLSGGLDKANELITNSAKEYIDRKIEEYKGKKVVAVFDLDETLLSNYNEIAKTDFSINWNKISYDSCTLIRPTFELYNYAIEKEIGIILITARNEVNRESTVKNLKRLGVSKWDSLFMMPKDLPWSTENSYNYKMNSRKSLEENGSTVMFNIGDQIFDLKGGYSDTTFKLINILY